MPSVKYIFVVIFLICLAGFAFAEPQDQQSAKPKGLDYHVDFVSPKEAANLADEIKSRSQLVWLHSELPADEVALERRVLADEESARKILRSLGYYEGEIKREIDWESHPVHIIITFVPGTQTKVGKTDIMYTPLLPATPDAPSLDNEKIFPKTLETFDLAKDAPARAADVLKSVDAIAAHLEKHGYPKSRILESEYLLLRDSHTLDAAITVDPGVFLRMGTLHTEGAPNVKNSYLQRLVPWQDGEVWNADRIQQFRQALQETGLFSLIDLAPDCDFEKIDAEHAVQNPVSVLFKATEAPFRSVGGGVRYSTDTGPGVSAFWEHRNFFGAGENLRISAPISQDLQMLSASFRKPEFGRHGQSLVAEAEARNETTDAYDHSALYGAAGIERRLQGEWKQWWVSARLSAEGGEIEDHLNGRKTYSLFGIPLGIRRDTTTDLFNPVSGTRLSLSGTPYTGVYDGPIHTVRMRADASAYFSIKDTDRIVFAVRGAAGSLLGASEQSIPAPLRFYSGGGGSVRGYTYQTIGPMRDGDPAGGRSFTDMSFETRFRVGENFGIVPFLDGGMVYSETMPKFDKAPYWGAGIGFRYFTPIGPIRLDFGIPLQDRENQKKLQFYFSIGQAF